MDVGAQRPVDGDSRAHLVAGALPGSIRKRFPPGGSAASTRRVSVHSYVPISSGQPAQVASREPNGPGSAGPQIKRAEVSFNNVA